MAEVDDECGHQQHHRQHRAGREVVLAHDGDVHAAGQDPVVAAQHERVAQIRQRFHEEEQEGRGDAGREQRQLDLAEGAPLRSAQVGGGLTQ